EEPRCYGVDPNALTSGPLLSKVTRQTQQPRLARRIGRLRKACRSEREHAADVDDAAARPHHTSAGLCHPVRAREIDVDDSSELLWCLAGGRHRRPDPRVIDEYIDLTELSHSGVDESLTIGWLADISSYGKCPLPHCSDLVANLLEPVCTTGAQHDVGACGRKAHGDIDTEPGGRSGHDCDSVVEAELIEN